MPGDPRDTPAMRQHARFKARYPDCLLLFRMGDFYEAFDDDAVTLHKTLNLTLTRRTEGIPMAGIPYHQLDNYMRRLTALGLRVAVADQVQDPKEAKGIVERAVTRVFTPGTLVDEALLEDAAPLTVAAIAPGEPIHGGAEGASGRLGVAVVEVSTGVVVVLECAAARLGDELAGRGVREVLVPDHEGGGRGGKPAHEPLVAGLSGVPMTPRPAWHFRQAEAVEAVLAQYGVKTTRGFGLAEDEPSVCALGAVLRYLRETQTPAAEGGLAVGANLGSSRSASMGRVPTLAHLRPPRREDRSGLCVLDAVSLRALEVERTLRPREPAGPGGAGTGGGGDGSLVGVFLGMPGGGCETAMGKRLLRQWLCRPLGDRAAIEGRQAAVAALVSDRTLAERLGAALGGVQDVARIAGRVAMGRATPRDVVALGRSLARAKELEGVLEGSPALADRRARLVEAGRRLEPIAARISAQCVEDPPSHLREGGLIRDGVDAELDEARSLRRDGARWLAEYQQRLQREHGLAGLKVGYNAVFGYYIELTAAQARQAPAVFTRKQTLKNAERYITPELKAFEDKANSAEVRAVGREQALFDALCEQAASELAAIGAFGDVAAELDVLLCMARRAVRAGWVRPEMVDEPVLEIRQGRHPVLEDVLGDRLVPNDVELGSRGGARVALITGPNMAGKSTYIRMAALVTLLAHAGSFVPAEAARVGVADRVFTRVGADDALHAGQSTFMVEMIETATILNHATSRSMVILDEIGRGTSTLDGLSLAWSIAEFLAAGPGAGPRAGDSDAAGASRGPRTLFATHYHELTELEDRLPGQVRNVHVSVREWGEEIVFLHRILPGRSSRSYGVHVARLAGVPREVIDRANEVLGALSVTHGMGAGSGTADARAAGAASRVPARRRDEQMPLFTAYVEHPAVQELRAIRLEELTPMQAFDRLRRLHEDAKRDQPQ